MLYFRKYDLLNTQKSGPKCVRKMATNELEASLAPYNFFCIHKAGKDILTHDSKNYST